jgi:hypothetical protein
MIRKQKEFEFPVMSNGELYYLTYPQLKEYVRKGLASSYEKVCFEELKVIFERPILNLSHCE